MSDEIKVGDLAAYWPDMPDLADGIDRFAEHPIAGAPAPSVFEGLVDDYEFAVAQAGCLGGVEL